MTIPELQRLHKGFRVTEEQKRKQLEEENPELRGKRVRRSDRQALRQFKEDYDLE